MMLSVPQKRWLYTALSVAACTVFAPQTTSADVTVPSLFTSHMVLQQGQKNRVWGWAEAGEDVTVSIASQKHATKAAADGKWMVQLEPLALGNPLVLTIQGKNTLTIEDVLVGEVWLCSGQSNMQWDVNASTNADLERITAKYPQIRLISVPQVGSQEPLKDFMGSWQLCTPETVGSFSAVGYFFGRELHTALNVPIGLIDNAWGGSACEAWIRRDLLDAKPELYGPMMARWAEMEKKAADPAEKARYAEEVAKWKVATEAAKAAGKPLPPAPQNLDPQMKGQGRPANLYNGVLKPILGYGIRGAIWYQGESNAGRAYQYRDMFPLMIQSWRDEWQQGDFPFYWVQLADFLAEQPQPVPSAWAELREAQTMTMSRLPNTGEAVIIDIGEGKDIHPQNKLDVGRRLARWALAKDYGVQIAYHSPIYKAMEKQGDKILLKFDHVGRGFRTFDVAEAVGFAIAGADQKWVWAKGKVTGPDTIEVSAEGLADPVAVRYAWADNPVCNVFSADGLPLTPFRTDDWAGVTANAK